MAQDNKHFAAETERSSENSLRIENEVLRRGFTIIPNTVLRTQRISRDAKLLYGILLSYAWQKGSCWPGYDTLTADLECGRSQLSKWIGELRSAGLISVQRRGQGLTSIYTIKDGPPEEIQKSQNGTTGSPSAGLLGVPSQDSNKDTVKENPGEENPGYISNRDIALSKSRQGRAEKIEPTGKGKQPLKPAAVKGFTPIGSLLPQVPTTQATTSGTRAPEIAHTRAEQPEELPTTNPAKTRLSAGTTDATRSVPGGLGGRSSAERALLVAYLGDYVGEFHDQASLKSSVTRALHLFQRSTLPMERWTEKLFEARTLTKERYAAIGYQGQDQPRTSRTSAGVVNRMPYFFALLECVLGLHEHPAGQHPLPLTSEQFQRQQRSGGRGKRSSSPAQVPLPAPQTSDDAQARPRLAGQFSHLIEH